VKDLTELESADAYCRFLARRHYENFAVTSLFLSRDTRTHLSRIYAFCRTTDELGDESTRLGTGHTGLSRLLQWRTEIEDLFRGDSALIHPVLIALAVTIRRFGMPERLFQDLIQANVQDQTVTEYETWAQLRDYCMLSAAPVGRMVLHVFGLDAEPAQQLSDDVCVGLQLANFAQDVGRDRDKGRTYLLQEDLRAMGTEAAIRLMCDRATALLESGRQLERMAPPWLRAQLALYRLGGMAIVDGVRRSGYRSAELRPTVSTLTKLALIPRAALTMMDRLEHAAPQRAS